MRMIWVHREFFKEMRHQSSYALDAPDIMPAGSCIQICVTSEEMDEEEAEITYMAVQREIQRTGSY